MKHIKIIFVGNKLAKVSHKTNISSYNYLTVLKAHATIVNDFTVNSTRSASSSTLRTSTALEEDFLLECSIERAHASSEIKDVRMIFTQMTNWNFDGNQAGSNQTRLRCTISAYDPVPAA